MCLNQPIGPHTNSVPNRNSTNRNSGSSELTLKTVSASQTIRSAFKGSLIYLLEFFHILRVIDVGLVGKWDIRKHRLVVRCNLVFPILENLIEVRHSFLREQSNASDQTSNTSGSKSTA